MILLQITPQFPGYLGIRGTLHPTDEKKYEKIEVEFAKTNRLKNSSIPYMPRILNSENLEFEKQDLKKKMKFHGVKNIEKKMRLY